jgi:hypothetical protein
LRKLRFTAKFSKENSEKLRLATLFISFPKTQKGAFLGGARGTAGGERTRRIKKSASFGARNAGREGLKMGNGKKQGRTKRKRAASARGTGAPVKSRTGRRRKSVCNGGKRSVGKTGRRKRRFSPRAEREKTDGRFLLGNTVYSLDFFLCF